MPDFTVTESDGPTGLDRARAEQEFELVLREAAANMLRIIRGAGRPAVLIEQMSDVFAAAAKYREVSGQPPIDILQTVLHCESETEFIWEKRRTGQIDEASSERRRENGQLNELDAEDRIKAGVLQIIASQLVGRPSQKGVGVSEMRDGINRVFAAQKKRRIRSSCEWSLRTEPSND
jgi:hypothetical protein